MDSGPGELPLLLIALALLLGLNFCFYLEDLLLEGWALLRRVRARPLNEGGLSRLRALRAKRFAVLVPNFRPGGDLASIRYENFAVFLGVDSENADAWAAARKLEQENPAVIVVPQSRSAGRAAAWTDLARRVLASESATGFRYEAFLLLEGADSPSPEALLLLNDELERAALVQLPLLPRRGAWSAFGAGAYADEAADLHRELLLRSHFRGALFTRGSGTALSRALLEALLARHGASFAHSYALGINAYRLGFRGRLSLAVLRGRALGVNQTAPESVRWAIRRRARFAFESGVEAQQDFGFGASPRERYVFWRDRRWVPFSLAGLALSIFFLGHSLLSGGEPLPALPLWVGYLSLVNLLLASLRLALRMRNCRNAYGWRSALLLPLRAPVGSFVQSVAQWRALHAAWKTRSSLRD